MIYFLSGQVLGFRDSRNGSPPALAGGNEIGVTSN
jgi:hypothetical protein